MPRAALQCRDRLRGGRRVDGPVLRCKRLQEIPRQFGDVGRPFAQRRQFDFKRNEPEIQILAESALHDPLVKIPVRGRMIRKSLRTGRPAPTGKISPYSSTRSNLTWTRGNVGHFVEKDRAAVGLFQKSLALLGAGERPANVAEQFALGQRRAQRRDVDRTNGPASAAVAMDGPGDQFLAGALSPRMWTHASVGATTAIRLKTS